MRVSYQHLSDEHSCLHDGYTKLYAESGEEFSQMTKCNMAMNTHLQEMMQEDEGATIRIEELERKLRLAESLAGHIYTKYEEVAHENHEEHSQFDEVTSKMEDMTSEMPGAFQCIQEQNQLSDTYSRRAQHLTEENKVMMSVADELRTKMLMLQDENSNMLGVAQREREKQWSAEVRHLILTNEAAEHIDHQYQEKRMIEHLRGQLALVKGSEMNAIAEMGNHDLEQKTEIQAYKLKVNEREMRAKQFQYEARVMAEATKTMEDAASKIQVQSREEQRQLREANSALTEANKVLRREICSEHPQLMVKKG